MNKVLLLFCPLILISCYRLSYEDPIKTKEQIVQNASCIESYINNEMKRHNIEKASIAIVCNDEVIYLKAFNTTEDDQFQAASISKPVVAYAALQLVEQGKLELDKPLSTYLTTKYFDDGSKGNEITLRMILSHTSGMSNHTSGTDRKVYSDPGKEFHYSGAGFEYLKIVMQDITGMPFDEYMEQYILYPLGMINSKFSITGKTGKKYVYASGGLVTSPKELAKFFIEIMNPGKINGDMVTLMLSDSIKLNIHNSWGLGIGLQHGNGEDVIWHSGNNGNVWLSLAYFSLKEKVGIIIMTKGKSSYKIFQDIAHYAIGGTYYGLQSNINGTATNK
jgi:CubicO group peptidase (beta-lactamase class C family)